MRLLLIAYEYPPSPSPQSLRWIYLTRELARLGHEVHVLAPDLGGDTPGLPPIPAGVTVHRVFPGPVRGLMSYLRKRAHRKREMSAGTSHADAAAAAPPPVPLRPPRNWKQRISEAIQATAQFVHFPDIRGEWRFWAARALPALLDRLQPDLVLSSHEPATTLELGLQARRRGFRWVADLGDPVLAGYTPRRWRRRAHRVERATCTGADLLLLTNPAAAALLAQRHGASTDVAILPQGFDRDARHASSSGLFDPARLELFYTGSFYQFRRPDALLAALTADPSIRLSVAAISVPENILAAARQAPERIRLLGFLPHLDVLALQRQADVLINIANDDPSQIPGKFNEYLGARRPILHLRKGDDPVSQAVTDLRRGWVSDDDEHSLTRRLRTLADAKRDGRLDAELDLDIAPVESLSWQAIGERLDGHLRALQPDARPGRPQR